jgi:hypothetical protein
LLAFVAVAQTVPRDGGASGLGESLQLAHYSVTTRSKWKDKTGDSDADPDTPDWGSTKSRFGGPKTGAAGYNPRRVQRFWSHLQGSTHEAKSKPLEQQSDKSGD